MALLRMAVNALAAPLSSTQEPEPVAELEGRPISESDVTWVTDSVEDFRAESLNQWPSVTN